MTLAFCPLWGKAGGSALRSVALHCGGGHVSETFDTNTNFLVGGGPSSWRRPPHRSVVLFSAQALPKHSGEARSVPRWRHILTPARSLPAFPVPCPLSPHATGHFSYAREARALTCVMHTVCAVALDTGMTTEPLSFTTSLPAE